MKVKELIEILKDLNQEHQVVMSKDAEGNGYSPLSSFDEVFYEADSTWSGEIADPEDTIETNAVCLWPVN